MTGPAGTALIAGIGGIIGDALARTLLEAGWTVRGLSRRGSQIGESIAADLADREALFAALKGAADTTHVFYAALKPDPDLATEAVQNEAMLTNLIDGLEAVGAPLRRIVHYQGFKIFGVHLGAKVRTPARESDPYHLPPNIYLGQQRILEDRAGRWDFVVLRPDVVIGDVWGNPMNIALVVGAFAEISRACRVPMRYPGIEAGYNALMQMTDSGLLARASLWAVSEPKAGGHAFNVTNGDVFRWERVWPEIAEALDLACAYPIPLTLGRHMADKGPLWAELAEAEGLVQPDLAKLVGWDFGHFIFNTAHDVISDVNKIRAFGFTETLDTSRALLGAIDRLKVARVLPGPRPVMPTY